MGAGPAASRPVSTVSRAPRGGSTLHAVAAGNHTAQPEPALGKLSFGALSVFDTAAILAGECHNATRAIGRSVGIATLLIAAMFVLGTGSVVAPVPSTNIAAMSSVAMPTD